MNKFILSIFLISPLSAVAWNVSTEPSQRSSLIEEYTGIHCPNCPDGHKVSATLSTLHPDDVYVVAIHAGSYAVPGIGEPDFRTSVGEALHDRFDISFYPGAVISRTQYSNSWNLSRSAWGSASREILKQQSPVNLWASSSYDSGTRTLKLDVEGYLTEDMEDPRLNVFLLQNEILGPQSGGQAGFEYPHRHMLRDRLTGDDFGDPIETKNKGEYFSRSFSLTLPEKILDIPTDPVNMELLVFVTEGDETVCKVVETRPDTSDLDQPFIVSMSDAPLFITKNYAFNYFEVILENHGGVAATNAKFEVTVNKVPQICEWTGNVAPHTSELIKIPLNGMIENTVDEENTSYIIKILSVNDNEVESPSIRGSIQEVAEYPYEFYIKIQTDLDAIDNTWRILDTEGNIVYDFGPYENEVAAEYKESVSLEPGVIYCLEIFDCWGDGICHPQGNVKLFDTNDKQLTAYREIRGYGMRQFFRTVDLSSVETIESSDPVKTVEYYNLEGKKLLQAPSNGIYITRTIFESGRNSYKKCL